MRVAGVPPRVMGIGPVPATEKAFGRAGITLDDVGLVEVNEAFAAQSLAVLYELGMDAEDERLNPNGGAIALGHPLGCSGARLLTTLVHEMGRRPEVRYGLATMCIGSGRASRWSSRGRTEGEMRAANGTATHERSRRLPVGGCRAATVPIPGLRGGAPAGLRSRSSYEIKEVLLQGAIYCGVTAANSAFAAAQRVLDEHDAGSS